MVITKTKPFTAGVRQRIGYITPKKPGQYLSAGAKFREVILTAEKSLNKSSRRGYNV